MRESAVINFFKDHDGRIRANMKQSIETAIDLAIFKELLFEKGIITKEEYQTKVDEKTQMLFGQPKVQEAPAQKSEPVENTNEPVTTPV